MKKIIITLLLMVGYINGKWRVCDENTYDANGNIIRRKYKDGRETLFEYDSKGNEIHIKSSWDSEMWYEYDVDGELIREIMFKNGTMSYHTYDNYDNNVVTEDQEPFKVEYNSKGNRVYEKDVDANEKNHEWWFESKGNEMGMNVGMNTIPIAICYMRNVEHLKTGLNTLPLGARR